MVIPGVRRKGILHQSAMLIGLLTTTVAFLFPPAALAGGGGLPPPPVVTGISPASGPPSGGTLVHIVGSGFTGVTQVIFGGSYATGNPGAGGPASTFTVVSDSQITALSPPGSGRVGIIVAGPNGQNADTPADRFSYTNSTPAFNDLGGYGWAAGAIESLATQGVVRGTGPDTFNPGGLITRAQFAALLQRTFGLPPPETPVTFSDVAAGSWEYAPVEALAPYLDHRMLADGSGLFHPDEAMERQDVTAVLVTILATSSNLTILTPADAQRILSSVSDAKSIAPDLQTYVATAIQDGLIKGFPDGSFQPNGTLNRAQVAVIIQRTQSQFPASGL